MFLRIVIVACSVMVHAMCAAAEPVLSEHQKLAQSARVLLASIKEKSSSLVDRAQQNGYEEAELAQQLVRLERLQKFLGRWCAVTADKISEATHNYGGKSYGECRRDEIEKNMENLAVCTALVDEAGRLHNSIIESAPRFKLKRDALEQMHDEFDRVVVGDIFRVPNGICKNRVASILGSKSALYAIGDYDDAVFYEDRIAALNKETASVQVWATTRDYKDTVIVHLSDGEKNDAEGSCNWADHGHPRLYAFPSYLPLSLFIDAEGVLKREGDIVTIKHYNPMTHEQIKIVLRLSQGKYRYRSCGGGHFDQCIKNFRNYESDVAPFLSEAGRADQ